VFCGEQLLAAYLRPASKESRQNKLTMF